jgi:hypothetical protein
MAARLKALRRPPAYQTYATDDLASARYYTLTLAERGLLDAMRRVYWADDGIPADLDSLALSVRRPKEEVEIKSNVVDGDLFRQRFS